MKKRSAKKNSAAALLITLILALCSAAGLWTVDSTGVLVLPFLHSAPTAVPTAAPTASAYGNVSVHYIDVGQGDSIYISLGDTNILIDGGDTYSGDTVCDYLTAQGCTKLDMLFITHPHEDHIGGLYKVAERFPVSKVYLPRCTHTTDTYTKLLKAFADKKIPVHYAKPGTLDIKTGKLTVLAPTQDEYTSVNDYSIVLKLTYKDASFLFTGDAEKASERLITGDVSADVLKLGHHGSSTSTGTEFLERVSPLYGIISCGKGNDYGHPNAVTVKNLQNAGVGIFSTDECGSIVVSTDGHSYTVSNAEGALSPQSYVFITDNGSSYHTADCRYYSNDCSAITITEAERRKLSPCGVCHSDK